MLALAWTLGRFRPLVARGRCWVVPAAIVLAGTTRVLMTNIGYGQINLLLMALCLADLARREETRFGRLLPRGALVGLAAAIKLTPGLFIVYLALTRRWRAAITSAVTFGVVSLVALLFDPHTSVQFWTSTLWDTSRVGQTDYTENQSLLGLMARLAWPADPDRKVWAVLVLILLVVGMWRAVSAFRRGDELVGITITGLTGNLISPISWTHHLYWVVPAVLVLIDVAVGTPVHPGSRTSLLARPPAVRRAAAAVAALVTVVFVLSVPWFWKNLHAPHIHAHGFFPVLGENSYVPLLVLLVLVLPVRALGARRPLSEAAPSAARTTAPPRPAGSSPR
jgi:alpha-1,2-mannosyltransferase